MSNADFIKVGDKVRHINANAVATVIQIRMAFWNREEGFVPMFRLDFGHSLKGPFNIEMNRKEYRREAIRPL